MYFNTPSLINPNHKNMNYYNIFKQVNINFFSVKRILSLMLYL